MGDWAVEAEWLFPLPFLQSHELTGALFDVSTSLKSLVVFFVLKEDQQWSVSLKLDHTYGGLEKREIFFRASLAFIGAHILPPPPPSINTTRSTFTVIPNPSGLEEYKQGKTKREVW